ncbi:MAG: double-strand break repair protein AddB [Mangrovicoccus sp.]|nr:double-strand break repair protein AddB [Mangrovicoccus sp.]
MGADDVKPGQGQIWGIAPGADFPGAFAQGLLARFAHLPPEDLAQARVYLNSGRMLRRVRAALSQGPARLLPHLALITDLGRHVALGPLPPARSGLRRRLELAQLVEALLVAAPDLAPRSAAFALASSLANLLDEMQGEGVGFEAIAALDLGDQSGHWARSQEFLGLLAGYLNEAGAPPDAETRQRLAVETLLRQWRDTPPDHPVIIAGSTGSRGTTQLLMQGVLDLAQGHVVLPGVDFAMPETAWPGLTQPIAQEDHPQYRFADLLAASGRSRADLRPWGAGAAPDAARGALISLALRPAPVTDRWQIEGPGLGDLPQACAQMSLIEAPDPRHEASAIALRLRQAAQAGQSAALISPDRMLTRRVTAMLARWGIEPDDSAGEPLSQSPMGRLLRQIAGFWIDTPDPARLIALMKHPLVHQLAGRNDHLRWSRDYELWQRRFGPAFPTGDTLRQWAHREKPQAVDWADWLGALLDDLAALEPVEPLPIRVSALLDAQRRLISGHVADPLDPAISAALWAGPDGRSARSKLTLLEQEAEAGSPMNGPGFAALLTSVLAGEVRDPKSPHPGVMIWGTLEARVQGADLVVLGGLTENIWPPAPDPDPWLNRRMRAEAGLLSPERRVGLSAHDFQQAVGAPEVVLTRALRDGEAPTVPSRWLNRLTTLLDGLPDQGGRSALAAMRARGAQWLSLAKTLDLPAAHGITLPRAPRPSPLPPPGTAPSRLSVSDVEKLIRDPYAIYASRLLGLKPLDPLHRLPDAALRGTVLHAALEQAGPDLARIEAADLLRITGDVLDQTVPWPHIRALWQARLARVTPWFLSGERSRLAMARPEKFELKGQIPLGDTGVSLNGIADRVDQRDDGGLNLYDYKTGAPPTPAQQSAFNKQLLLVAAMAEAGGFEGLPPAPVGEAAYIGLGASPKTTQAPLAEQPPMETLARTAALLAKHIAGDHGYTARRAKERDAYGGDFDHLSRYGEWQDSDPAQDIPLKGHADG